METKNNSRSDISLIIVMNHSIFPKPKGTLHIRDCRCAHLYLHRFSPIQRNFHTGFQRVYSQPGDTTFTLNNYFSFLL